MSLVLGPDAITGLAGVSGKHYPALLICCLRRLAHAWPQPFGHSVTMPDATLPAVEGSPGTSCTLSCLSPGKVLIGLTLETYAYSSGDSSSPYAQLM